jgi:hypothetical protein
MRSNLSVERLAAGGTHLQNPALGSPRLVAAPLFCAFSSPIQASFQFASISN